MTIALLLGAGFSKWSCNLPLVAELFDLAVHSDNVTEERRLRRLAKIYADWRGANPEANNEAFIQYAQGRSSKLNLVNWYVTRRLTEPFVVNSGRRYTWYINSGYAKEHQGVAEARRFLKAVRSFGSVGILTTNYDLVVEYALGTRGFNYGVVGEQIGYTPYPYRRPVLVTGEVPIAKLHGSISWRERAKFPDQRGGLTGKCLIVPPIPEKWQEEALESQWILANRILQHSEILVVFGFAFNEYDSRLRKFVSSNIGRINTVIIIDVVDHRKRLNSVLNHKEVHYLNPLLDDFDSLLQHQLHSITTPGGARNSADRQMAESVV